MKAQKTPFVLLAVGLVFLLASLGVAYGLWAEELVIDGTVLTGEVYGEWTSCICTDDGLDPFPNPWPYPYPKPVRKDVGSTTCEIDQENPHILRLKIENAYPSYWGNCEVHYANTGSVPVHVQGFRTVAKNFKLASANGAEDGEIWVKRWFGAAGEQLEPCPLAEGLSDEEYACEAAGSIQFHIEQPALENYTYEFEVLVCIAQWNEDPTLDECLAAAP